ncbi:MAG TPA: 6-bladed beta-propeller [Candidatus Deferrimicrobium sp.]|nr:6-bladed beta-propeller [Candidatus Kapabacteria bacterium]HLP62546.1 6-bladed beta-propeller [Candidatus Deferrimicrobium sp.]
MLISKLSAVSIFMILLLTACNADKDISYQNTSAAQGDFINRIALENEKEITLDTGADIIGSIMAFKIIEGNFLIADPIHSRQCYLFDDKGKLMKKIGRSGEGPGEYLQLLTACNTSDRIFLIDTIRINIYSKNGDFIKATPRPFLGLCNSAYEGPNNTIYILSYNRYNLNTDTIYQLDKEGNLIKSFAPVKDIPPVFDTFFPQTGICTANTRFFQYFNFTYELNFYDFNGKKQEDITLASPFYTPPNFREANVKGHQAEKEYRATFTQVNGFFEYPGGYISILTNWKSIKDSQNIFEFWSKDFKRIGFCELAEDEYPLGVFKDRIISAEFEKETKLIFKKIILKSSPLASGKS